MNNILKQGALYKVKKATFTLYSELWIYEEGVTDSQRALQQTYTLRSSDIFFVVEYMRNYTESYIKKHPAREVLPATRWVHYAYCVLFKENIWYMVLYQEEMSGINAAGYVYSEHHLELLAETAT